MIMLLPRRIPNLNMINHQASLIAFPTPHRREMIQTNLEAISERKMQRHSDLPLPVISNTITVEAAEVVAVVEEATEVAVAINAVVMAKVEVAMTTKVEAAMKTKVEAAMTTKVEVAMIIKAEVVTVVAEVAMIKDLEDMIIQAFKVAVAIISVEAIEAAIEVDTNSNNNHIKTKTYEKKE